MNVLEKIARRRIDMEKGPVQYREASGKYAKKRDIFLLWGEYPKGWAMIKDLLLCIFLMNLLIGEVSKIDLAEYVGPKVVNFAQEATIEPAKAESQPEEVKTPLSAKSDLVDTIYAKESSRGVNNYSKCATQGKYNRYGFGIPGDGSYVCFEKDEDTKAVAGWVALKRAQGLSDNAILCAYNTGKATETCDYLK